jgi:hypothetical protein
MASTALRGHPQRQTLSADNAHVTWVGTDRPWLAEQRFIASVDLPLNLDQNRQHAFHQQLTKIRADARRAARVLPIGRPSSSTRGLALLQDVLRDELRSFPWSFPLP